MAVLSKLPGFSANIIINGKVATEFQDPGFLESSVAIHSENRSTTGNDTPTNNATSADQSMVVSKYIEVIEGVRFDIQYSWNDQFSLGPGLEIHLAVQIDGDDVHIPHVVFTPNEALVSVDNSTKDKPLYEASTTSGSEPSSIANEAEVETYTCSGARMSASQIRKFCFSQLLTGKLIHFISHEKITDK